MVFWNDTMQRKAHSVSANTATSIFCRGERRAVETAALHVSSTAALFAAKTAFAA